MEERTVNENTEKIDQAHLKFPVGSRVYLNRLKDQEHPEQGLSAGIIHQHPDFITYEDCLPVALDGEEFDPDPFNGSIYIEVADMYPTAKEALHAFLKSHLENIKHLESGIARMQEALSQQNEEMRIAYLILAGVLGEDIS